MHPNEFKSGGCYLIEVARQRLAIFLCQSMIFNLKTSNRKSYMPYKSMSLKKSQTPYYSNTMIKYNTNKRSEPLFQKIIFYPPGSDKSLNFFITPPKTFQLSLRVAGKRILTLSTLSRSSEFLPLSDRTIIKVI